MNYLFNIPSIYTQAQLHPHFPARCMSEICTYQIVFQEVYDHNRNFTHMLTTIIKVISLLSFSYALHQSPLDMTMKLSFFDIIRIRVEHLKLRVNYKIGRLVAQCEYA